MTNEEFYHSPKPISFTISSDSFPVCQSITTTKIHVRKTYESPLSSGKHDKINIIDPLNPLYSTYSQNEIKPIHFENHFKFPNQDYQLYLKHPSKNYSENLKNQVDEYRLKNPISSIRVTNRETDDSIDPFHQDKKAKSPQVFENKLSKILKEIASPEYCFAYSKISEYKISKFQKNIPFLKSSTNVNKKAYHDYVIEIIESLEYIKMLDPHHSNEYKSKIIQLPPCNKELTVIFDLDETLIHLPKSTEEGNGEVFIKFNLNDGSLIHTGINIRPGVSNCLKKVSKYAEIIIFTASLKSYADAVVNNIDPYRKYISLVLDREYCVFQESKGIYIKDLRILNRDLKKTVIIDNSIISFAFQLDNGIPAIPFISDQNDYYLGRVVKYLDKLRSCTDVRSLNKEEFNLSTINDLGISIYLKHYKSEKSDQDIEIEKQNSDQINIDFRLNRRLESSPRKISEILLPSECNKLNKELDISIKKILRRCSKSFKETENPFNS